LADRTKVFAAAGGLVVILALVAGGIWYQFFRDTAPPAATIESAVESIQRTPTISPETLLATATAVPDSTATTLPATPTSQPAVAVSSATQSATEPSDEPTPIADTSIASLDGTWIIADIDDRFVGYRIGEELVTIGTTEAVGRTSAVEGSGQISNNTLVAAGFSVDMTTLTSDDSRRDNQLRRQSLETNTYPDAKFELTEPLDLPDELLAGQPVSATATGILTLHGVSHEVDIPLDIQLVDDILVTVGALEIILADYDIALPRAPSVLSVNEQAIKEIQLFFVRDVS
jgi:polyisoprenoid-binding protein YceI